MNETITKPRPLIAIVNDTEHTQKYLVRIRRQMRQAKSDQERAGYALIALRFEASLKESK